MHIGAHLDPARLVDLTQPLGPATPLWPDSTPFEARVDVDHERDGAYARTLRLPEHSGTHLDAPAHFAQGGPTIEAIPLERLVRPAVVVDARPLADGDPGFLLERRHLEEVERRDGPIPAGCAVLVCFGWDAHVGDPDRYLGPPGALAFPGLAEDAARLLVERRVAGLGVDTLSTDAGSSTTYPVHGVILPAGIWQLEGLVGLDRLPPRGAWLVAAPLLLVEGSGTPARVFALLP